MGLHSWMALGPAIHVDVILTHTTYLSIVADLPDGCGLIQ